MQNLLTINPRTVTARAAVARGYHECSSAFTLGDILERFEQIGLKWNADADLLNIGRESAACEIMLGGAK